MITILRRRKLGRTSCREISNLMQSTTHVVRNDRFDSKIQRFKYNPDTTMLIRWGCTSQVPCNNVLNTVEAIQQVNDKIVFRNLLRDTNLIPQTWFPQTDDANDIRYPVILRDRHHAQGRRLFVANNVSDLKNIIVRHNMSDCYATKLVNKVSEYRVFVGSGRAIWVAQKTPGNPEDIAWNVAQGGRFDNVRFNDWPLKVVKTAIEAFNYTKLDFGGVDVIVDSDNNAYVLEINSAPSQTSPYRQECVAKYFDYVVQNGKKRLPLIEEKGGYLKFIHPAIDNKAKIVNNG
jgi:glutathione synthase/RimK-type ligase-like ATP-grasp enzyme